KNPLETAHAISNEARFHHLAGRHRKAIELLKRAVELVEPVASADSVSTFGAQLISQVYGYLAGAYQHYGLYEDSNKWSWHAVKFGERLNVSFAQAMGYEFLGENAVHLGEYETGLEYSERERVIVERIHSRERRAWTHFVAAMCSSRAGDPARAEREYTDGIALAEATGERRAGNLLKGNFAEFKAEQALTVGSETPAGRELLDEALAFALENFTASETGGLLYMLFEAHRCLATVRWRRGELDEAEKLCAAASDIVSVTESRVSQLWLGPLYIEVLIDVAKQLESEHKLDEAAAKLKFAGELLTRYQQLVGECQTQHFVRMAAQLEQQLQSQTSKPAQQA
ncbi:MAG TPA: tetratricopeptide repeat protein, partial [Pyrinomonadaceae bacterium]